MRILLTVILLSLVGMGVSHSQSKLKDNRFEGYIVMADGSKKDVMIEVDDVNQPWTFQENVRYFDRALLKGPKIKREQKLLINPEEIVEYGVNGRKFIHISYYIKSASEDNIFKSTMGKIKDDKNTDFYAEVIKDGPVSMIKFYIPPAIDDSVYDDEQKLNQIIETSKNNYDILLKFGAEKGKSMDDINISKQFKDCEFVVKKYETGKYKIKSGKSIKAFLKGEKKPGPVLEGAATEILADYDAHCQK